MAKVPYGHWQTTTLIAALGMEGIRYSTVVDGPVNGDIFESFVEQVLMPELRPGDVVIMDNLSSHHRLRTREVLWQSMQAVLDTITPNDAFNCFRHCGYTLHGE